MRTLQITARYLTYYKYKRETTCIGGRPGHQINNSRVIPGLDLLIQKSHSEDNSHKNHIDPLFRSATSTFQYHRNPMSTLLQPVPPYWGRSFQQATTWDKPLPKHSDQTLCILMGKIIKCKMHTRRRYYII